MSPKVFVALIIWRAIIRAGAELPVPGRAVATTAGRRRTDHGSLVPPRSSERYRSDSAIGQLDLQSNAASEVEFPDRRLEFGERVDRHRRVADGQDPHAGPQAELECRAAGDDAVDLDDGLRPLLIGRAARGGRGPARTAIPGTGEARRS